jgi:hypothetical protein
MLVPNTEQKPCQNLKIAEYQRDTLGVRTPVRKIRHPPRRTVGNLHRMLQARYCSAALIIDERVQI